MKRFHGHILGVDQGDLVLFSDFEDDGPMWTGAGPRQHRRAVSFAAPFRGPPAVHVALSMWDVDTRQNVRVDISAENIGPGGFDLVFRTWSDSRVARVRASWMALGEMPSDEDWIVD